MSLPSNQLNITDSRITKIRDFINTLNIQDIQGHPLVINPSASANWKVLDGDEPFASDSMENSDILPDDGYDIAADDSGDDWELSDGDELLATDSMENSDILSDDGYDIAADDSGDDWELSDGGELLATDSMENSDILPDDGYDIAADDSADDITESGGDLPLGAGRSNTAEMDAWWADMLAHDISLVDDGNAIIDVVGSYEEGELINVRSSDNCDFSTYWVNNGSGKYEDSFLLDDKADIICDADGNMEILTASSPDSYGWITLHSKAPSVVFFTDEGTAIRNSSGSMPVISSGDINMAQLQIDLISSSMLNVPPIISLASEDMISAANLGLTGSGGTLSISSDNITLEPEDMISAANLGLTGSGGTLSISSDNMSQLQVNNGLIGENIVSDSTVSNYDKHSSVAGGDVFVDASSGLSSINDRLLFISIDQIGSINISNNTISNNTSFTAANNTNAISFTIGDALTEINQLSTGVVTISTENVNAIVGTIDSNTLKGTVAVDKIYGWAEDDTIYGLDGNDTLDGGEGNDTLAGGRGADSLTGGAGNDAYRVDNVGDVVIETSTLTTEMDKVNSLISYTLGANVENLTLKGAAAISGLGNELNNLLKGNGANNILQGDIGNDRLIGGLGKDNLTGGLGADKFKFNAVAETGTTATTRDIITDFSHAQRDKINLSAIDANTDLAGNNAFSAPTVGGTFSGTFANPGELYFDQTAHILYGNNDADNAADFSIKLAGVNSLAASDVVL